MPKIYMYILTSKMQLMQTHIDIFKYKKETGTQNNKKSPHLVSQDLHTMLI